MNHEVRLHCARAHKVRFHNNFSKGAHTDKSVSSMILDLIDPYSITAVHMGMWCCVNQQKSKTKKSQQCTLQRRGGRTSNPADPEIREGHYHLSPVYSCRANDTQLRHLRIVEGMGTCGLTATHARETLHRSL